jgi:DNA-binding NarL/FixJ family response regulator
MITIIIADDHQVFRQGLKRLLADDDRFQLLGEARDGRGALELIDTLQPDVAVLDLAMPRPDGIDVTVRVSAGRSRTRCIILTMKEEISLVRRALAAGARGYLLKESAFEEVAEAIVKVAAGKLYLGALQESPELFAENRNRELTDREIEILRHVARGLTSKQIAAELCISPRTVETHRQNVMEKLNVNTSAALINVARGQGLI